MLNMTCWWCFFSHDIWISGMHCHFIVLQNSLLFDKTLIAGLKSTNKHQVISIQFQKIFIFRKKCTITSGDAVLLWNWTWSGVDSISSIASDEYESDRFETVEKCLRWTCSIKQNFDNGNHSCNVQTFVWI